MPGDVAVQNAHHDGYSSSEFHNVFSVSLFPMYGIINVVELLRTTASHDDADGARLKRRTTQSFQLGPTHTLLESLWGGGGGLFRFGFMGPRTGPNEKKNDPATLQPLPP